MNIYLWLLYVMTITLLIVAPGPVAMLCLRQGARYPFKYAFFSAVGGTTASCVIIFLSLIGIGAFVSSNMTLLNVVKIAGALYLFYLGISHLRQVKSPGNRDLCSSREKPIDKKRGKIFLSSFLIGVSNPKDIIFFIALFPQFIQANSPKSEQLIVLVATWIVIDLLAMTTYVAGAGSIIKKLTRKRQINVLELIIAIVFIALAAIVMFESL